LPFLAGFSQQKKTVLWLLYSEISKGISKFSKTKRAIFCQRADNVLAEKRILTDETATNF
jgi:hypothetical protein